jgi:APA family basic amino acid/polyamine antiporter
MSSSSASAYKLTLLDAAMLVMGTMIGSGIFIVSADIVQQVHSPLLLLAAWGLTAVITVLGALSYAELAAAMPQAGGQYVYLRESLGPLTGFLYGWTVFAVIQTGTAAAVAVGFAKFTGVFVPGISAQAIVLQVGGWQLSTQQLLAIGVITLLTGLNFRTVKTGAMVQTGFSVVKIGALVAVLVIGLVAGLSGLGSAAHFSEVYIPPVAEGAEALSPVTLGVFLGALTGALFSADAWNNVTYAAAEVRNPQRNLPLAMVVGTGTVVTIYLVCNLVYVYVLGPQCIAEAPEGRVGTALMQATLGDAGLYVMAGLIMVSTFGCLNGVLLSGGRVYYAMANDGLFFRQAGRLNRNGVPAVALAVQGIWAAALTLTGSYGDLLNYVMVAVLVFYILTISGLFILRRKKPQLPRPYRVVGYPVLPALYILLTAAVTGSIIAYHPDYALGGLIIIAIGIPLYFLLPGRKRGAGGN